MLDYQSSVRCLIPTSDKTLSMLINHNLKRFIVNRCGIRHISYPITFSILLAGFAVLQISDSQTVSYSGIAVCAIGILILRLKKFELEVDSSIECGAKELASILPESWEIDFDDALIAIKTQNRLYLITYPSYKGNPSEIDLYWDRNKYSVGRLSSKNKKIRAGWIKDLAHALTNKRNDIPSVKTAVQVIDWLKHHERSAEL